MKSCWTVLGPALALIGMIAFAAVFLPELLPNPQRANTYRATCTSNLHEIYQALKIYKDDHGTYPEALYGFVDAATGQEVRGLYPQYLKDATVFRCPLSPAGIKDQRRVLGRPPASGFVHHPARLFPIWDSYDGQLEPPHENGAYVVRYVKQWNASAATGDVTRRQLGNPNASEDTVVTWCGYHRQYSWGQSQPSADSLDLVLFLDGHVKPIATARMHPAAMGGVVPPDHSYRVQRD